MQTTLWLELLVAIASSTGLSAVVTKLVLAKFEEAIKHDYAQRLEAYKNATDKELEQFRVQLTDLARVNTERWNMKREACLEALEVVDNLMTNHDWGVNGIVPQPVDVCKAREVLNKLILTCDNADVVNAYLDALGVRQPGEVPRTMRGDCSHDLRIAIRKELSFGSEFEIDRGRSWIAKLG